MALCIQSNSTFNFFNFKSKESIKDDYRYDYDYWDPWNKQ